ncbi:TetR/AcrR family transcriptional regulator [Nocardioides alcanivorans]|uniref:TetR/AcrR family transcriptional regulator n=1 Tax=Nocardioides alcanivorans TaxID=2897352 RepID=UPI001F26F385|nr:TetR/AcrR family transcriptional regulator [Nocardioides alcanivorans]
MARAGLTPEVLTQAAAELADEIGFAKVTVAAVARRFGVKDASLYSHVRNLRELQVRVAEAAFHELADQVASAIAGLSGRAALAALTDGYRRFAAEHPGQYASMRIEIEPGSSAARAGARHAALSRAVLRSYALEEPDATDALRMMNSTLHGFVELELAGGFSHSERSAADSWAATLVALDAILANWPSAAS